MHQSAAGQSVAAVALLEKHAKTRLAVAADHFNRDYKKGFQFLQVQQAKLVLPQQEGPTGCLQLIPCS